MTKLIYLWVENYNDKIIRKGFEISPEYNIQIEPDKGNPLNVKVLFEKRDNIIPEKFYGENILSLTAIVGENGCGKTTAARMLMHSLYESMNVQESLRDIEFYETQGFDSIESCIYFFAGTDGKLYFYTKGGIFVEKYNGDLIKASEIQVKKWWNCGLYITNVFNTSELLDGYLSQELEQGRNKIQTTYSPSFLLKSRKKTSKDEYGSFNFSKVNYLKAIDMYAAKQTESEIFELIEHQARLFLQSKEIMDMAGMSGNLNIYRNFGLKVTDCRTVFSGDMNNNYKEQLSAIRSFYINKSQREKVVMRLLYYNMLCEVSVIIDDKEILQKIIEELHPDREGVDYNDKLLDMIPEALLKIPDMKKFGWYGQIAEFCRFLSDRSKYPFLFSLETGSKISFENKDVIDWLKAEKDRQNSFIKRNLFLDWCPASSGELAFVNIFSYIAEGIKNINNNGNDDRHIILIIDEIDAYLHPRWQQKILKMLLKILTRAYPGLYFQIIVTSHSPIILSDFFNQNTIKLIWKDGIEIYEDKSSESFAANIEQLYYNSFFMKQGDIGEISKEKIGRIIEYLLACLNVKTEFDDESIVEEEIEFKEMEFIIHHIGNSVVKRRLWSMLEEVRFMEEAGTLSKMYRNLDESDKEQVNALITRLWRKYDKNTD